MPSDLQDCNFLHINDLAKLVRIPQDPQNLPKYWEIFLYQFSQKGD